MAAELLVEDIDDIGDRQFRGAVDRRLEVAPETLQQDLPVQLSVGHLVELPLELCGEIIFDIAGEEIVQEADDKPAPVLGDELAAVLDDIGPVLKHLNDRGIGRRPADAELLHRLDQAGIGETRWRLGEMLLRLHLAGREPLTLVHGGKDGAVILLVGLDGIGCGITPFLIDRAVAVEHDDAAARAQHDALRCVADIDGRLVELGGFHLAGDGALPDQVIEALLVIIEIAADFLWRAADIGWADGLVGFLRVGGRCAIDPRAVRQVPVAETLADLAAHRGQRLAAELHAVGPHIGDQACRLRSDIHALIKFLGDLHGAAGRKSQLARRFLLQGRCGEGRFRILANALGLNVDDAEPLGLDGRSGGKCLGLRIDVQLAELLAIEMRQPCIEIAPVGLAEFGLDRPVFLRDKCLDGGLALADQAQRHRLDAPGGPCARQLAPQHRRDREADKVVECAARPVGVDQLGIQFARLRHGGEDGVFGNFVEDDALDRLVLDQPAILQQFENVPADRLSLAVGVGGEDQPVGRFQRRGDFANALFRAAGHLPFHGKILVRQDRTVLARQVANMPVRRQYLVVVTKVTVDGLGFCG